MACADQLRDDVVSIANNKFGAHVLVKAVGIKELEVSSGTGCKSDTSQGLISDALIKYGIFESMQTGARKVWRPVSEDGHSTANPQYLGKCRSSNESDIFNK